MAEDIFANDPLFGGVDSQESDDIFASDALVGGIETSPALTLDFDQDPILGDIQLDFAENDQAYQDLKTLGDRPEADRPEGGFIPSVKSGFAGVYQSAVVTPAQLLNQEMVEYAANNFPGSAFDEWTREESARLASVESGLQDYREALPVSKTLQTMAQADTVEEFITPYLESEEKWTVVKEIIGSSAPFTAGMAAGTAYAGLPGTFSSVFLMDWGDSYQESKKAGKSGEDAALDATTKALTQAFVDTTTMGIARLRLSANKIKDWTGQLVIQAVGGGGAEALKHEFVDEDYKLGGVLLEATGELAGGPLEILVARATQNKPDTKGAVIAQMQEELKQRVKKDEVTVAKENVQDVIEQLEKRMEEGAQESVPLEKFGLDAMTLQDVGTGASVTQDIVDELDKSVTIERADGGIGLLGQADWEDSNVQLAEETHVKAILAQAESLVTQMQGLIEQQEVFIAQGAPEADPHLLASLKEELITRQEDAAQVAFHRENEQAAMRKLQGVLKGWTAQFAPGMRILLSPSQVGQQIAARVGDTDFNIKHPSLGSTSGQHYTLENGVDVIEVDVENARNLDDAVNQAKLMETAVHEFSHGLMNHLYENTDIISKAALVNGYRKWLKQLRNAKSEKEFYAIRSGKTQASFNTGEGSVTVEPDLARYVFGMNEYLANQMSKGLGSNELLDAPVRLFFKKAIAKLKEFFTDNKHHLPEQSFTDFINLLAAKTTMSELEKVASEKGSEGNAVVVGRAYQTVSSIMKSSKLPPSGGKGGTGSTASYGEEEFRGDLDKYNGVLKWGTTLLQMGKLNPHIAGLQNYIGLIKEWWNIKMQQTARADERLQQWNDLKGKDSDNLGGFMQELTVKSYEAGERYTSESSVFRKLAEKYEMSEEMLALVDLIENDFTEVLLELEAVQIADARRAFTDDIELGNAITEIVESFEQLRGKNFFPLSRFGAQYMRVIAARDILYDGVEYKMGETLTFETFEKEKQMLKRQGEFKNKKKYIVEGGLMNDTQKQFAGFPPQFLSMLKERLDLNEVQTGEFEALIADLAPGKSFTKHMMHRKNTPGYSTDAVRSYANYFLHFGNYVARIKYKGVLQDAISEVGDSAKIIAKRTGNGSKRTRIQQFMQDHYEVAMNPGNELANLRALGFLWYLGFVPKSALVNLTQVPLVTYPYLAARHGDAKAIAALGKATKDAAKYFTNPKGMTKGQMDMIDELIRTGILDESMATELAAASEGSLLQRVAPGTFLKSEKAARGIRRMAGAGAWMFQKAEKMNRRVTALAAYNLTVEAGGSYNSAVAAARDAVESTQYEYARWNRPRFSQGKKSVMFLFWQYMQNSLFFLAHDPGRMRYVAMMILFAGLSGLPFAKDAMALYDYISRKLNKKFGEDFAPVNIELAAREFIDQLGMNPDLVMHGASRYSFGMSALGDAVGLPIPNVDMSGSLSMGNIIPGWEAMLGEGQFDKGLGRGAEELGGAVIAMPIQLMRAIADGNPDTLKRFERAMPSFARNMSKAYRYATRNEETLPDGTPVTKFNIDDSMHRSEILAQALGFAPTRVAEAKEPFYMTKEILQYYALRRQSLMEVLDYAKRSGDSKLYRKTWTEVRKFNKSLQKKGLASMGLRPSSVRRSLKDRQKQRVLQELGYVGGKQGVQVTKDVYESFDLPEEVP